MIKLFKILYSIASELALVIVVVSCRIVIAMITTAMIVMIVIVIWPQCGLVLQQLDPNSR